MSSSDDDVKKLVERLQKTADAYAQGEVELSLADQPRLYRIPKCKTVGLMIHNPNKVDLLLDTEGVDHRFVIELDSKAAETLYDLLEHAFRSAHGR